MSEQSADNVLMKGVSGVRGVVGKGLTPAVAMEFAQAYATYLSTQGKPQPRVLVARDTRPTGEMVRHAVLAGLVAGGCRVTDLGIVTTPTLQLAIPHHEADGGICITASHNPIEWNALKFFQPNGMYLDKEMGGVVLKIAEEKTFRCGAHNEMGSVHHDESAVQYHLDQVLGLVDVELIRSKKFKVLLDGCCGAGNTISPTVIRELGCELVLINGDLSGQFPHNPEPRPENMVEMCEAVKTYNADIGFAHDADADRVAIATDEGEFIGEDYSLVWAVAHVLKNRKRGPVVTNLSTSMAVETVARQYDCDFVRVPVGDINVSGKMREVKSAIGGEGNGGVIIPDIQYGRDGIAALALTLEFLARSDKKASEIARELPHYVIEKATIDFDNSKMDALKSWLKTKEKAANSDERDGLRLDWDAGSENARWVHVRPSGTEPFVRIICEAKNEDEAKKLLNHMRQEVEAFTLSW